jgi:segregation and condensation protein A
LFRIGLLEFAKLAARALTPKSPPLVQVDHIHQPFVSIREMAVVLSRRLRELGRASFRQLTSGAFNGTGTNYEVVACFLALLELYREDSVSFEQVSPLGDLYVTWTAGDREVGLAPPGARREGEGEDGLGEGADGGAGGNGDADTDGETTESDEDYT